MAQHLSYKRLAKATICGLMLTVGGGALQAQAVVIRASGPSAETYPPRTRLASGTAITLKAGDLITVVDKGSTRIFKGPGKHVVDASSDKKSSGFPILAASLTKAPARRGAGTVRDSKSGSRKECVDSATGQPFNDPSASIWAVDIKLGGRVCLPEGSKLYLWRNDSTENRFYWLSDDSGGTMQRLRFPAEVVGVGWPSDPAPVDKRVYELVDEAGGGEAAKIQIVSLGTAPLPDNPLDLVLLLQENSCISQVERLTDSMRSLEEAKLCTASNAESP